MENTNIPNEQNINDQFNRQFSGGQKDLPNATSSLVLGIIATFFGLIWCYWIGSLIGIICGIIALKMGSGAKKVLSENPDGFTKASANNSNAGKILGIIGLCLGCLGILVGILVIILVAGSFWRGF